MKKINKKLALTLTIMSLALSIASNCFAQTLEGVFSSIKTPTQLSTWLLSNLKYEWTLQDDWQNPREILAAGSGDCDDFAVLSQAALKRMGIESDIIIVKFRGLDQAHAICSYQSGGFINFFSNGKLTRTNARTIEEAISKYYPDWEKLIFTDASNQPLSEVLKAL